MVSNINLFFSLLADSGIGGGAPASGAGGGAPPPKSSPPGGGGAPPSPPIAPAGAVPPVTVLYNLSTVSIYPF